MKEQTSYPKEKINILFLENISDKAVERFRAAGYTNVKKMTGAMNEEELIKAIKDVHLIGVRSKTKITANVIKAATKLQAIGCFCIGTNQVDLETAKKAGIAVFNAPYSNTRSVAELVIATSILLIRKILDKNKAAHDGIWLKDSKESYELRGKTMGIIGYGSIGTQLSILAEALGMKVLFYDVATKLPLGNAAATKSMKDLVSKSDIISLHVPETPETKEIVNEKLLKSFKDGSILINFARGHCVEIDALVKHLNSGHLSGAAIDVFPVEPKKIGDAFETPLRGLSNVLLTPISAALLRKRKPILERMSAKNSLII
ncbi:phosphoglycerate dehydrogenase [Arachidicoccus ginsenosidivorans]